eukprot:jgi/Psemu1/50183/gm1.50183_g
MNNGTTEQLNNKEETLVSDNNSNSLEILFGKNDTQNGTTNFKKRNDRMEQQNNSSE